MICCQKLDFSFNKKIQFSDTIRNSEKNSNVLRRINRFCLLKKYWNVEQFVEQIFSINLLITLWY